MVMKIPYVLVCIGMLICLRKKNFIVLIEFAKKYKKFVLPVVILGVIGGIAMFIIMDKAIIMNLI